ncbi:MAG: hypothetical protein ACO25F_11235 [Erythrobacter sp.]
MSSIAPSRGHKCALLVSLVLWCGGFVILAPLRAQDALAAQATQPDTIDILAKPAAAQVDPARVEECRRQADAATISREIVVCREIADDPYRYRTTGDAEAQARYARETMYANDPQAPDVAGPGIFRGPATVGGLCIPGLQKCPPPPALMIDVTALPQAPPGSDADRIARGLPPLGQDGASPDPAQADPGVSPEPSLAESAAPEAQR